MIDSKPIPTAQEQLQFLKNIQRILQSGSFSSTYKFALLISLTRLAIEQGQDNISRLVLEYTDIAEKFIELYWKQSNLYDFEDQSKLILNQNNGRQAAIVKVIIDLKQSYISLGLLRRDKLVWQKLLKDVVITIKGMPVKYLQITQSIHNEFLYRLEDSKQQLILLPKVMYCLRQFSEIIEELCQKRWIDFIRTNKTNSAILSQLPDLEKFMFEPDRNQLSGVATILENIQHGRCFYCNKTMKKGHRVVDHFIPWSMYPSDTGHNFVLADAKCNSKKSNFLASYEFKTKWHERNKIHDRFIVENISELGFLTNIHRSHKVADWAYAQAKDQGLGLWGLDRVNNIPQHNIAML